MKNLLLALALSLTTAYAQMSTHLSSSDESLSFAKTAQILAVDSYYGNCPRGAHCQPTALIKVSIVMAGCLDKLGPVTADIVKSNSALDSYELRLSAINIHNKRSKTARCIRANTKTISIIGTPRIRMNNLKLVMMDSTRIRVINDLTVDGGSDRACTANYAPVCAIPKVSCERGRNCTQVIPTPTKTFSNRCQMDLAEAKFVHNGKCTQDL